MGMATALAAIGAIVLKDFSGTGTLTPWTVAITAVLGVAVLATVWCSLQALVPRNWRHDPDLADFANGLPKYTDAQVMEG